MKGCNKGSDCEFFHPQLCNRSVKHHVCYNVNCRYFHVKGTKRTPPRFQDQRGTEQDRKFPQYNHNVPSNVGNHSVQNPQNHFLFLLQQMKADILQAMDQRFSQMSSPVHQMIPPEYGGQNNQFQVASQQERAQWVPEQWMLEQRNLQTITH